MGADTLVGAAGVAVGELWPDGQVKVDGEIWRARCDGGLRRGHDGRRARGRRADARRGAGLAGGGTAAQARGVARRVAACSRPRRRAAGGGDVAQWEQRATAAGAADRGERRGRRERDRRRSAGSTPTAEPSARVDAYSPALDRWRTAPRSPASASTMRLAVGREREAVRPRRVHGRAGDPLSTAFVLERGAWRRLPRMPFPRAAAGAAVAGRRHRGRGRHRRAARRLARNALAFDLRTRRWSVVAGSDAARAPGRDVIRRHGLRGRRPHVGPRHEPPPLRELPARRRGWRRLPAGAGPARRDRSRRARRAGRLGRRRGARRDDSRRCSRTASRTRRWERLRICRRRDTARAWPRSAAASS